MAEWNAPVIQDDHAARACETALLMMEELGSSQSEVGRRSKSAALECQDKASTPVIWW